MSSSVQSRRPRFHRARFATGLLLTLLASWLLDACVYRSETIECNNGVRCPPDLVCAEDHGVCGPADKVAACSGRLDGESCNIAKLPGTCKQGMCELSPCESHSDCPDDDEPCTDSVCNQGRCELRPNTAPCDDDHFCNGPDRCQAGACMSMGELPCVGNTQCNEEEQTCVGCKVDTDCRPDSSPSEWSACQGSTDVCATSGLRSRLVVSWMCNSMQQCEAQTEPQTEPCPLPAPTGRPCDDHNACTESDQCTAAGQCAGDPLGCDDGNECTRDDCGSECTHEFEQFGSQCQGGNCDGAGTCLACPGARQPCNNIDFGACEAGILLCDESGNQQCYPTGPKPSGTPCREPQGLCDAQELCNGTTLECPGDASLPDGTPCGPGLTCTAGECR